MEQQPGIAAASSPASLPPSRQGAAFYAPQLVRIPEALRIFGLSRAGLYREQARGTVIFRKHGRSTLVDVASLQNLIASLPTGTLRP